jgi:predicted MPP superfamily phosphohydrolase
MKNLKKYYSKEDNIFYINYMDGYENKIKKFKTFKGFAKFLQNDLTDADLYDYDFEGIDLKKYYIDNAGISSSVLIKQGLFDTSFYEKNIGSHSFTSKTEITEIKDSIQIRDTSIVPYNELYDKNEICISYISDLHLDHKIKERFPVQASRQEIVDYIKKIIEGIELNFKDSSSKILLIGGDVSSNFSISEIFYQRLRQAIPHKDIYVVLGNHEFWDTSIIDESYSNNTSPINLFEMKYRNLLEGLNIDLIFNEMLILNYSDPYSISYTKKRLSEKEITAISNKELRDYCKGSFLTILGGTGFSAYSKDYNASHGLYRDSVKTLEDDNHFTKRFELIYQICKQAISDKKVLIFTHMPKDNWSKDNYCNNWIYVNGHTHRNYFISSDDKTVYADNQIGYINSSIALKHFYLSKDYDLFEDYCDGIYEITKNEYIAFYLGHNISISYNRDNTKIFMLKRSGIYCFIQENLKNGNFYLLNGGAIKKLNYQNNLGYYFDNLEYYANSIDFFMSNYNNKLNELSKLIKSFGGSGHIHGSIVDIDFFNHLYLNPFDGQVIPYFAYSMTEKYVYKNLSSLIYYKCKDLYKKYNALLHDEINKNQIITLSNNDIEISKKNNFVPETDIYKFSRIAKSLQYITKIKVVRIWSDELIKKKESEDTKKILFLDLIE